MNFIAIPKLIKRIIDLFISFIIVFGFLPIWVTVAILIKLDSEGPVFFLQERPGYETKIFKVFKFRTMKLNSAIMVKGQEVSNSDDRITKIGKFLRRSKLDEIPQLLNVILGQMSLVGPRPERMDYMQEYTKQELKRFDMLPGLTGLAQVSGNIHIPLEKRHQLDVYYVERYSLWLDIKILVKTVGVVLFGEDKFK